MINNLPRCKETGIKLPHYKECIEVMDNVFIGSNSTILSGVRIGPNAPVVAGSVVTKDVHPGTIVGVPAKVMGDYNSFVESRISEYERIGDIYKNNKLMWEYFYAQHDESK